MCPAGYLWALVRSQGELLGIGKVWSEQNGHTQQERRLHACYIFAHCGSQVSALRIVTVLCQSYQRQW